MKIEISNEVLNVEDGKYIAVIDDIHEYGEEGKILIKLKIEKENETLLSFSNMDALGRYPWSNVFKALNTNDTDDLIGQSVEFEVKNEEKGGNYYCNIKKITVV